MSKSILMVVANNGFQDTEFSDPYDVFKSRGFDVTICAGNKGECVGVFGKRIQADIDINEAVLQDFDMFVFIGGGGAYSQYFGDKTYLNLAQKATKLGAICITPMILSDSGIFNGVKVTGRDQNNVQKNFITKNGGIFLDQDVVVCGNIVTANGPLVAGEFAEKCVSLLLSN